MIEQTQVDIYDNPILERSAEINNVYGITSNEKDDKITVVKSDEALISNINNDIYEKFEYHMYSDSKWVRKATLGLTETFLSPYMGGGLNMQGEKAFLCKYIYSHEYGVGISTYMDTYMDKCEYLYMSI